MPIGHAFNLIKSGGAEERRCAGWSFPASGEKFANEVDCTLPYYTQSRVLSGLLSRHGRTKNDWYSIEFWSCVLCSRPHSDKQETNEISHHRL